MYASARSGRIGGATMVFGKKRTAPGPGAGSREPSQKYHAVAKFVGWTYASKQSVSHKANTLSDVSDTVITLGSVFGEITPFTSI
jgi:hypothetical protein